MIVDKAGLPDADRPGIWQISRREEIEPRAHPGDTPILEEPGDELPVVFVSRPPLIPRVFPVYKAWMLSRGLEGSAPSAPCRRYWARFGPKFWKRRLKRASCPPVSSSRCWPPVQAGCDFGSISRRSVSPSLP